MNMEFLTESAVEGLRVCAQRRGRPHDWAIIGCAEIDGRDQYYVAWRSPASVIVNRDHLYEFNGLTVFVRHDDMKKMAGMRLDFFPWTNTDIHVQEAIGDRKCQSPR